MKKFKKVVISIILSVSLLTVLIPSGFAFDAHTGGDTQPAWNGWSAWRSVSGSACHNRGCMNVSGRVRGMRTNDGTTTEANANTISIPTATAQSRAMVTQNRILAEDVTWRAAGVTSRIFSSTSNSSVRSSVMIRLRWL